MSSSKLKPAGKLSGSSPASAARPIDLRRYMPFFLGAIANKWTALSSRSYRSSFNLGIGEWRVLASLAVSGSATSLMVAKLVKMDSGAVSRAIRVLEGRQLVVPLPGRFPGRTRPYAMTPQGTELYEALKEKAFEREARLLEPLSEHERRQLLSLLGRVYDHLDNLEE